MTSKQKLINEYELKLKMNCQMRAIRNYAKSRTLLLNDAVIRWCEQGLDKIWGDKWEQGELAMDTTLIS